MSLPALPSAARLALATLAMACAAAVCSPSAGAAVVPLAMDGPFGLVTQLQPTSDGTHVLLVAREDYAADPIGDDGFVHRSPDSLWFASADGTNAIRLSPSNPKSQVRLVGLTPDGLRASWYADSAPHTVLRATTDGTARTSIPLPPSGRQPAFGLQMDEDGTLYVGVVQKRATGFWYQTYRARWNATHFTRTASIRVPLAVGVSELSSPSGEWWEVVDRRAAGTITTVTVFNIRTGSHRSTRLAASVGTLAMTDDGTFVAAAQTHGRHAFVVLKNGHARFVQVRHPLARHLPTDRVVFSYESISPSGRYALESISPSREVYLPSLVDLATGRIRVLHGTFAQNSARAWSADERSVTVIEDDGHLDVIATAGGSVVRIRPRTAAVSAEYLEHTGRLLFQDQKGRTFSVRADGRGPQRAIGTLSGSQPFVESDDLSHAWALPAFPPGRPPAFWALSPSEIGVVPVG